MQTELTAPEANMFAPRHGSGFRGRLWATDPSLMSLEEAAAIVAETPHLMAWASAVQAAAVERVREGMSEAPPAIRECQPERLDGNIAHALAVTEVALLQGTSEAAAARLMNTARELSRTHVAVMDALESGDITDQHARTIVDQAASLPESAREAFGIAALAAARTRAGRLRTPGEFRRTARDLREKMHPESIQVRKRAAAQERGVWLRPEDDGMVSLSALLPAETGMAFYRRIDAQARSEHRAPGEHRTLPQLRADTLAHLGLGAALPSGSADGSADSPADGSAQSPAGGSADGPAFPEDMLASVRAEVVVHVPASVVLGSDEGTAYLDGYGVVDAGTARRLAAEAPTWHRIFDDVDGAPLRIGRTAYRPPEPLRRFLRYRDGTCRFPGCTRPAESSDIDHTKEWQDGGGTDADNLAHLCARHHALKSLALIQARQEAARTASGGQYDEPTGTIVFTTMLTYERTTTPADRDRMLGQRDMPAQPFPLLPGGPVSNGTPDGCAPCPRPLDREPPHVDGQPLDREQPHVEGQPEAPF